VRLSSGVRLLAAATIGIVIGALTSFGQAHLNLPWSAPVNSASPWLLGGFAAGALQASSRRGVLAGLGACVLEVMAYYAVTAARGYAVNHSEIIFWTVCALVGGPLFGWSGWAWHSRPRLSSIAIPPLVGLWHERVGQYRKAIRHCPEGACRSDPRTSRPWQRFGLRNPGFAAPA
jgi:hypothetical protein